jgi:hypothetical protein
MRLEFAVVLAGLVLCSAPMVAQEAAPAAPARPGERGWALGVTGFTGGQWAPTGVEVAMVRGIGAARARNWYAGLRTGSWTSETSGLGGGTQGWFLGVIGGVRHNLATLLEVGANPRDVDYGLLTGAVEITANLGVNAPTGEDAFVTAAYLFGLSYSDGASVDEAFALLLGPVVVIGRHGGDLRAQIGLRFQFPRRVR